LKSAVINTIHNAKQRDEEIRVNDMCRSFQEAVTDVLVDKTLWDAEEFGAKQIVVAGGVAANRGLRAKLEERNNKFDIAIPHIRYCTDNAAMIGVAAYYQYMDVGTQDGMDLNGKPYNELSRY
jgi:N6-L-threonylcarbamoyladenine synthase